MKTDRVLAWVVSGVVASIVIAGIVVVGWPDDERLRRLDDRRIAGLQRFARAIDTYAESHDELPEQAVVFVDGRVLSTLPSDPVTNQAYGYQARRGDDEARTYRLCASFDRASPADVTGFWAHGPGRHCFDFTAVKRQ